FSALARARFGHDCFEKQGVSASKELWAAVGMLLTYLSETQRRSAIHLQELRYRPPQSFVGIDAATRRNLELTATLRGDRRRRGTLIGVLDKTQSSMGARTLVSWMEQPLLNRTVIEQRHAAVETLLKAMPLRGTLQDTLKGLSDLQRLITRVFYLTANARELQSIGESLAIIPRIKALLEGTKDPLLAELRDQMDPMTDLRETLLGAFQDNLPTSVREGGIIADGFLPEVDRLRSLKKNSAAAILEMEQRERAATGIKSLKITFNKVFGYYIEVTKTNLALVPERYIRKQTIANGERYVIEELKILEGELLTANERLAALEYETFVALRDQVSAQSQPILTSAAALAQLDVLCSLAQLAADGSYCRPKITDGDELIIREGRHPVVEQVSSTRFVPNDTRMDCGGNRMILLTGPNMAGKSTYMRQTAIIVLMAQMGSFVPAAEATIGLVDQIFTRVGASDDLAAGQSTFLVEMSETAHILKNATRRSLLIFDEIGRGTSTYDGMSIARAVIEYVADPRTLGARTLFATHYHELTALEGVLPGVCNYYVAAKKRGEELIFLRRILRGRADQSYGIEVARLAGVPQAV
ncbi:MAG: DNA mismatch repair protein MutS, partial [Clostridia bacterium]|nr:DNA mismatch repair protein MutS [Clostridia bacterium]